MNHDAIVDGEALSAAGTLTLRERELSTFVYCLWNVDRNTVKIGFSANLKRRHQQLQTATSDRLVFWGAYPGGRIAESVWHEALETCGYRKRGEWFDASDGFVLKNFIWTVHRQRKGVTKL